jgi:hypothetical protein
VELGAHGERWIAEHRLSERTRELYEGLFANVSDQGRGQGECAGKVEPPQPELALNRTGR